MFDEPIGRRSTIDYLSPVEFEQKGVITLIARPRNRPPLKACEHPCACCDTAELFELIKETLDGIALFAQFCIVDAQCLSVRFGEIRISR